MIEARSFLVLLCPSHDPSSILPDIALSPYAGHHYDHAYIATNLDPALTRSLEDTHPGLTIIPQLKITKSLRLAVFDLDSTLIRHETIDKMARIAGVESRVMQITAEAMAGKWDFKESLMRRLSLLKGLNWKESCEKIIEGIELTPGAIELFSYLKSKNVKTAIVSGGFIEMARHVAKLLGADHVLANQLETDGSGCLTGRLVHSIVDTERKASFLREIGNQFGQEACTMACGDGANDIMMIRSATIGVSFSGKPKVRAAAMIRLEQQTLLPLIDILDWLDVCQ